MSNSRVTNYTCAVVQLNARLNPEASYGHFLSCFGAQRRCFFLRKPAIPFPFHQLRASPTTSWASGIMGIMTPLITPGIMDADQDFLFISLLTGMDTCAYD